MKTTKKLPKQTETVKSKRSWIYLAGIEAVALILFFALHTYLQNSAHKKNRAMESTGSVQSPTDDRMMQVRNEGFQFIKPLLLTDVQESRNLRNLKKDITQLIEMKRKTGQILAASVYYRKLADGSWLSVNSDEKYRPGSINKIPLMMYYLKMSELQPGYLDKQCQYSALSREDKSETYHQSSMVVGKSYTIRDLLARMISQSDNNATRLLLSRMEKPELYRKVFTDLKMPAPQPNDFSFSLSARDCSKFMRVLYSSTYLSEKNSQFALDLLSKSTFTNGLVKNLPGKVKVAHKFGESGYKYEPEFSETGIVYDGQDSYLITIMTKGTDSQQQADAISDISRLVFDKVTD